MRGQCASQERVHSETGPGSIPCCHHHVGAENLLDGLTLMLLFRARLPQAPLVRIGQGKTAQKATNDESPGTRRVLDDAHPEESPLVTRQTARRKPQHNSSSLNHTRRPDSCQVADRVPHGSSCHRGDPKDQTHLGIHKVPHEQHHRVVEETKADEGKTVIDEVATPLCRCRWRNLIHTRDVSQRSLRQRRHARWGAVFAGRSIEGLTKHGRQTWRTLQKAQGNIFVMCDTSGQDL
mmetsp:Transcript_41822/g.110761  ORF Transcript_41822/g.110761 Transcript_41822/m.110761 type:complete len:236 (+) Transcript_41822:321-1028(+)